MMWKIRHQTDNRIRKHFENNYLAHTPQYKLKNVAEPSAIFTLSIYFAFVKRTLFWRAMFLFWRPLLPESRKMCNNKGNWINKEFVQFCSLQLFIRIRISCISFCIFFFFWYTYNKNKSLLRIWRNQEILVSWPELSLHLFQSYAKPPLGLTTLIKMQSKGWAAH